MPIPTPTDEMRVADRIRNLKHMKATLVVAAVTAASLLAVVNTCPIHSY